MINSTLLSISLVYYSENFHVMFVYLIVKTFMSSFLPSAETVASQTEILGPIP